MLKSTKFIIAVLTLAWGGMTAAQAQPEINFPLEVDREPANYYQPAGEMITTTVRTPSFVARFRASPEIDIQKLIPEKEVFLGDAQKFMQAFDDLRAIHYPDEEIWIEMQASQNNRATGALGMWWHGGWNLVRKFNEYFQWWYRDPPKAKGVVTMVMTPAGKSAGALKVYHRKSWNPQVMGWESGGGHGSNHLRFYITTGAAGYTYGSKVLCEDVTGCKFDWFSFYPF